MVIFSNICLFNCKENKIMRTRQIINYFLNNLHKTLANSTLAVKAAILLRNQCRCVIKYHLTEDTNPIKNGEAWLVKLIAPNSSNFIDVGANLGNWTKLFLESTINGEQKKGFLFDPSDYAIEKLKHRFGHLEGIKVIQGAVSDTLGQKSFFEEPEAGETSSLVAGFSNPNAIEKNVVLTTLDAEVEKYKVEYVDFLKIDAEGYDLYVLRGASGLLAQQKIGIIQFEYNSPWALSGCTLAAAFNLLNSAGYKVFLLKSTGLYELNYNFYGEYFEYSNFVAVSPKKMPALASYIRGKI